MIFGKLTFQCNRNCPQNLTYCPGSIQDTFIIYSSINHQHISQTCFAKNQILIIENLEISKYQHKKRHDYCAIRVYHKHAHKRAILWNLLPIILYSFVFYCILSYSMVFYCNRLLSSVAINCILWYSIVIYCMLLYIVSFGILWYSIVCYSTLLFIFVFYRIPLYSVVSIYERLLCSVVTNGILSYSLTI